MGISISRFRHIFGNKEVRILMNGLDAAGKTTMLYRLKLGEIVTTIPTIGFNVETVQHKNVSLTTWDIGGRDKIRPLWRHYYANTDACIFVVDSNDQERFEELREEMFKILSEDELRDVVVLIFANKQDLPNALGKEKIVEALRLKEMKQKWHIEETSIESKTGIYEGLDWLVAQLNGSTGSAGGKTQSAWSHLLSPFSWLPSWRKEAVKSTLAT